MIPSYCLVPERIPKQGRAAALTDDEAAGKLNRQSRMEGRGRSVRLSVGDSGFCILLRFQKTQTDKTRVAF